MFMSLSHSICYISAVPSMICFLSYGIKTGGPIIMGWSFLISSFFEILVSLSFAEICSAYP